MIHACGREPGDDPVKNANMLVYDVFVLHRVTRLIYIAKCTQDIHTISPLESEVRGADKFIFNSTREKTVDVRGGMACV